MNHPRTSELLPWYVNGTLDVGDRQAAALEVASCDECAEELDALTRVQAAVLELDAAAPEPDAGAFARALAAVEEEERKRRLGHPWFGWWWALTPFRRAIAVSAALGVAVLAIFIAVPKRDVVAPAAVSDQYATPIALEDLRGTSNGMLSAAKSATAPSESAVAPSASAVAPSANAVPPDTGVRLARTGGMRLIVGNVETALSSMMAIARSQSGAVLSLEDQTPARPGDLHTAHLELLVPEDRFDATAALVGKLGAVESRTVNATNVAAQIVDARARLRNLQHAEADYLKIMDRAGSIGDVLSVENQVSATREQIEQLEGEVSGLQHQIAFADISIDVADESAVSPVQPSALAQLRSTWIAALHSVGEFSLVLLGGLLWGAAYAPYVLGAALIVGLVSMRFRR